jgi:hypothetical protein
LLLQLQLQLLLIVMPFPEFSLLLELLLCQLFLLSHRAVPFEPFFVLELHLIMLSLLELLLLCQVQLLLLFKFTPLRYYKVMSLLFKILLLQI